jgi:hypothetical protein
MAARQSLFCEKNHYVYAAPDTGVECGPETNPKGKEHRVAQSGSPSEDAKEQTKKVARKASPWIDRLARMVYVAKGVVYVVIGFLALREALGIGGETTGPSSAFRSIGSQPFGGIMVALLAAGLAYYALWKVVQGIMDPDEKGSDAHGILRRVGYVGSCVIHGCLVFIAAQSILGAEDSSEDAATASAMAYQPPLGQLVVGVVVIGVGLYQLYAAYEAKFLPELKLERMGEAGTRWITHAGRVGTTARGDRGGRGLSPSGRLPVRP